jgi:hypothetical protein
LAVAGILLLTFKPHVGALILLTGLGWLIYNRSDFVKQLIRPLLATAAVLFLTGFIADPSWIISYPRMLLSYQSEGNVSNCSECASLPVSLSRWFFDGSLTDAVWIAFVLLIAFGVMLYSLRHFLKAHELLLSAALLITLLVSPYLYNYDFLLLLVPFAVLMNNSSLLQKILVFLCYLVPTFALLLYGREGNISLIVVSLVMLILLYARMRSMRNQVIDFTGRAAYNND